MSKSAIVSHSLNHSAPVVIIPQHVPACPHLRERATCPGHFYLNFNADINFLNISESCLHCRSDLDGTIYPFIAIP